MENHCFKRVVTLQSGNMLLKFWLNLRNPPLPCWMRKAAQWTVHFVTNHDNKIEKVTIWLREFTAQAYRYGWNSGGYVESAKGGIWGGVPPLQPIIGSGERRLPSGVRVWTEPLSDIHFGVFWRPQNAHSCTYKLMLWAIWCLKFRNMTKSGWTTCIRVFDGGLSSRYSRDLYAHE